MTVSPVTAQQLPAPPSAGSPATGRLAGVDLARGLAVFGMYAAHVGPDPRRGGIAAFPMELAHGRSSALFGVLAGVTLVIIAGRPSAKTGRAGRQAAAKIVIRSVVLVLLGTALTMAGTLVAVILAYYGLDFLLALPMLRLRARTLAITAAAWVLAGPQLLFLVQGPVYDSGWARAVEAHDPLAWFSGEGILELLVLGKYPALTWMPFLIAGMALGRLDLASAAVRVRLAVLGPALAVLGYGGSWLAFHIFPGIVRAAAAPQAWWSDTSPDFNDAAAGWLLVASPHSETTLSVVGSTGVAITVVVAALVAVDRLPRLRRLAAPAIAVGSMSLSVYVLHILAIGFLGIDEIPGSSLGVLVSFIAVAMALAWVWRRHFQRGPFEYVLNRATRLASRVR